VLDVLICVSSSRSAGGSGCRCGPGADRALGARAAQRERGLRTSLTRADDDAGGHCSSGVVTTTPDVSLATLPGGGQVDDKWH